MQTKHSRAAILLALILCLLSTGCAGDKQLLTLDQAKTLDGQLLESWTILATTYRDTYNSNEELQPFLSKNVKPVLEAARTAVLLYNSAVLQWSALGDSFTNSTAQQEDTADLYNKAWSRIKEVLGLLSNAGVEVSL